MNVLSTSDYQSDIMDRKALVKTSKEEAQSYQNAAFGYFEKLLDDSLHTRWWDIVKEQCNDPGYILLKGRKVNVARGRTLGVLEACYFQVTRLVCPKDAAKRHMRYLETMVCYTAHKQAEIKVVAWSSRLAELNKMTKYLPCLKHTLNSPAQLLPANQSMNEIRMCTMLLASLPVQLASSYFPTHDQHFPTDYNGICRKPSHPYKRIGSKDVRQDQV